MAKSEKASYKFPILEQIFNNLTSNGSKDIGQDIIFTTEDWFQACKEIGIDTSKRLSSSNVILDLTRKDKGIEKRLPATIIAKGYDLRKKTGRDSGKSYLGEFVFVGVGNALNSWLIWESVPHDKVIIKNRVPSKILPYLAKDEGALFSVIDYCDALSFALFGKPETVFRVQNPMKWQPNEIDGLYFSDSDERDILFPCEAKALSTNDDINLEQMLGGLRTIETKIKGIKIVPLALQMTTEGLNIGILKEEKNQLKLERFIKVILDSVIDAWQPTREKTIRYRLW